MKTERKKSKKQVTYNVEKKEIDNLFQLFKAKRIKECEIACCKLLKKYPALLPALNILGSCLNVQQKYDDAIQIFTKINTLEPTFTPAHYNRGIACHHKHLYEEAIKSFDRTIELEPNHIDAIYTKGAALSELNRYEEAITYLQLTVNSQKNNLHAMHALGYAYEKLQQYEKAKELYAQTINIDSNYAEAYSSQGRLNSIMGNKAQAVEFYKKALEVNPESANTHRSLSRLIKYTKNDPYISMMENIYNKGMKNDKKRMHLCYAMSKAYEDVENYDKGFNRLKEANDIRKKELNYNVNNDIKLVQNIMEVYSKSRLNINEEIDKKDNIKPIFILGMPRSGTSLVEQILSSHKEVYGAGELDEVREFIHDIIFSKKHIKIFSPLEAQEFHNRFLHKLESLNVKEKIIIDKMPHNFLYVGYILTAFPNAKIINVNRDPIAICWSIYQRFFPAVGIGFAYDLNDLATFYKLYENMMIFWKKQFPERIYNLKYETLTENQEEETRKLLGYCDLEWQDTCLNFHKTKRQVITASLDQVRNKMYTGSSLAWRNYEKYLQPLIKSLNYKGGVLDK